MLSCDNIHAIMYCYITVKIAYLFNYAKFLSYINSGKCVSYMMSSENDTLTRYPEA